MTTPSSQLDPLLERIVRDALDPSYAAAASRKQAAVGQGAPPAGHPRLTRVGTTGVVLMVAVGAVAGVAVSFQHKVTPQAGAARSALAGDTNARSQQVRALEQTLARSEKELDALQQRQLAATATGVAAQRQLGALQAAGAETSVRGPGVTVTVTDVSGDRTPTAGDRPTGSGATGSGIAADRDLQSLVNALWAGGAEAVAVSGIRLGPQTAIRTAGQTILVDFRAVRSPYVISAIGPPSLSSFLARAPAVEALRLGSTGTHPNVKIRPEQSLSLPAAPGTTLASSRPLPAGGHS